MNRFAALLDRLAYEPSGNGKLRLLTAYFRETPDPDRGYALASITGALSFRHAKPGIIRALIAERADPVLFGLSWDYVGDLSETVALMWPSSLASQSGEKVARTEGPSRVRGSAADGEGPSPASPPAAARHPLPALRGEGAEPSLSHVVTALASLGKSELPAQLAAWLDALDDTGRWALLKLVTGAVRIGVSARLAKTAVAALGDKTPDEVELVWHSLAPPYTELFAWVEGRAEKPVSIDPAPFHPVMLSHAIEEQDFPALDPSHFAAEWKWDGIRVQAVAGGRDGKRVARLYSRTGEGISDSLPALVAALTFNGALDGELLILRDGRVQSFNVLQQRLNRKIVNAKLQEDFPAHLRAYDLLVENGVDLRELPFAGRRARLEKLVGGLDHARVDISSLVPFTTWDDLATARADPAIAGAGADAEAVEGVMLKRRDALYLPGRPKGLWWKWKRDPHVIDAVLMYAQRGSGKRSSFYSDYTFGVWSAGAKDNELVPVGKAYFGFTDEELLEIDRYVRRNTINRFGPVREVTHEAEKGLVMEVAFEGLQRSTRHKSGVAMRFPRISRLRWDKPPREADRLETLQRMLRAEDDTHSVRPSPLIE